VAFFIYFEPENRWAVGEFGSGFIRERGVDFNGELIVIEAAIFKLVGLVECFEVLYKALTGLVSKMPSFSIDL
jgi:hypothetical protein